MLRGVDKIALMWSCCNCGAKEGHTGSCLKNDLSTPASPSQRPTTGRKTSNGTGRVSTSPNGEKWCQYPTPTSRADKTHYGKELHAQQKQFCLAAAVLSASPPSSIDDNFNKGFAFDACDLHQDTESCTSTFDCAMHTASRQEHLIIIRAMHCHKL